MKIICNKALLLNSINTVSKAVSSKTTLPILECILLRATPGGFKMTATDLELGIENKLENVNIIETGSIAIEAKIFSEIIRHLPDDDVEISTDKDNLTLIKCINSEYKLSGQIGDEFPDLPTVQKNLEYTLQQSKLKDMIRQTIFSISTDESKIALTGELLEIIDNSINLVSIDGYRVSFRKTALLNENENIKAVIPGKTLNEINKILSNEDEFEVSLYFTDKHILFDLGDSTVVSRIIDGDFIKYEQIFSNDYGTIININRKNLIMCLERASLLSKENKKTPVKMEVKSNKLIITSNTELGTAYEEIEIDRQGDEIVIAFNPKYIIDALKAIDDDTINMYFTSPLSPCTIKSVNGDEYRYLVLPVRLNS